MKFAWIIAFSLFSLNALGASCCVANAGLPQFILLPAKWQITTQLSQSQVIGDTSAKGRTVFRSSNNKESTTVLGGGIAYAQGPWQMNASFAWAQKDKKLGERTESNQGASDPTIAVVREVPVGTFGHRVWSFLRHTFAAADSIYDDSRALGTAALGAGRPQTGAGALYTWNGRYFDAQTTGEFHWGHASTRGKTHLASQPGGSIGAGGGWVRRQWRLGALLTARFEGASSVQESGQVTHTDRIQVWDSTFSLGKQIDSFQNAAISYTDQTLMGPTRNTTLSRTLGLLWQCRW